MNNKLTPRQEAEAIEQFGDDLAALCRTFDRLCNRMSNEACDGINAIPHQDHSTPITAKPVGKAQARTLVATAAPQTSDCVINGFYAVMPADLAHPPVAYVFGRDESRLFAAAPDLLEALKALFQSYKDLADSGDAGYWRLEAQPEGQQALAAIAKAEGEP